VEKMRVLVDTNIFLDVLLERETLVVNSQRVLNRLEQRPGSGWISWHTLSNLYYVGQKIAGENKTRRSIKRILSGFDVCPADTRIASTAMDLDMADFEDALQVAAGLSAKVEWIITRNVRDFKHATIPALTPEQALKNPFFSGC